MIAANREDIFSNISGFNAGSIQQQVRQSNAKRTLYLATGAVVCNIFFLLHFYFNVHAAAPVEVKWRDGILVLHAVFFCIHAALLVIAIYVKRTKQYRGGLSLFLISAFLIMLPLWGIAASVLDQPVTASIISFFLTCAVCALGLLMRPVFSLVYYAAAYAVFYFCLALTQTNANVLLSNRVNGFAGVAICFGVAVLLWRNNIIRYRQNAVIEQQKKDIQDNYEKLLQSAEELAKANAAKDKFFSIIAHDLRGPVSAVLSLTQFINSGNFVETPAKQSELLQLLQNSMSNTAKLLENLLVWSRSQTNRMLFVPSFLNLLSLVEMTVDILGIMASEKGITVHIDIDKSIEVYADAEMMNTILRNLLSNALKFTNNTGHVIISGKITTARAWPGNCVQVNVQDNGVGMTPALMEHLFRIDTKITMEGTKRESGTGLGLILCKEFIEKHNGSIRATSQPGKGSCFTFELPVVNARDVNSNYM